MYNQGYGAQKPMKGLDKNLSITVSVSSVAVGITSITGHGGLLTIQKRTKDVTSNCRSVYKPFETIKRGMVAVCDQDLLYAVTFALLLTLMNDVGFPDRRPYFLNEANSPCALRSIHD